MALEFFSEGRLNKVTRFLIIFGLIELMITPAWMKWWPSHVITINSLRVVNAPVENGAYAHIEMDYCKSTEYEKLEATVQYSLVGRSIINLPGAAAGPLESGCNIKTEWVKLPYLPVGATDETYRLEQYRLYHINFLKDEPYWKQTDEFKLTPSVFASDPRLLELLDLYKKSQSLLATTTAEYRASVSNLLSQNKQMIEAFQVQASAVGKLIEENKKIQAKP